MRFQTPTSPHTVYETMRYGNSGFERSGRICNHFRNFLNIQKDFCSKLDLIEGRYHNACCMCPYCTNSRNLNIFTNTEKWKPPQRLNTKEPPEAVFKEGTLLFPFIENDIKVIVFSDIHRDLIGFLAALVHAEVINDGLQCVRNNVVVVCCGDMLDGHRSDYALQEGNCREEIDLFQIFEYLNSIGVVVKCVAGNHEVMRKDEDIRFRGTQARWETKHLANYIAQTCPLIMNIGKLVFCHTIPDMVPEKKTKNGLEELNKMFYKHMHAVPDMGFHSQEGDNKTLLNRMLWDRRIVKTGECSNLKDFFKYINAQEGSIAFIGHTKAKCDQANEKCHQKTYGHVNLCKDDNSKVWQLHAMDTHWSLAFLDAKNLEERDQRTKRNDQNNHSQKIAYAVVTNVFDSPKVDSCVCDLQWSPRSYDMSFGKKKLYVYI